MKIGKINSRLQRLGQKARSDISKVVGKTSKVIGQVESGAKKAVREVGKFSDSTAVRGVQQGLGVAGRLAAMAGPQGQVVSQGLLGAQESLKEARKALPSKTAKVEARIGKVGGTAREKVIETGRTATEKLRSGESKVGNVLEKAPPKSSGFEELPFYVD